MRFISSSCFQHVTRAREFYANFPSLFVAFIVDWSTVRRFEFVVRYGQSLKGRDSREMVKTKVIFEQNFFFCYVKLR